MFASIREFAFVRTHRRECRSVHLSKQTEFDCGGIVLHARANFKTWTVYPPRSGHEQIANGRSTSLKKLEKRCREQKMFTPSFLDSALERYRQYSTLKMSISSDRRVIFSRSAPLRNVYEFVKRCTYISLNDFGERHQTYENWVSRKTVQERGFLIYLLIPRIVYKIL